MDRIKKRVDEDQKEQEIVYSKAVKAGKRIYYLDVKRNKRDDMFLAITESKKVVDNDTQVSFEKHKIFLYKEDFKKFRDGLDDVINFIRRNSHNRNEQFP